MVHEPLKYPPENSRKDHTSGSNHPQAATPAAALSASAPSFLANGTALSGVVGEKGTAQSKLVRPGWAKLSIKTKATALAVTLGVVPVLAVGGTAIYFANQIITQGILQERQRIAVGVSLQLSQFVQKRLNDVQSIARTPIATDSEIRNIAPPETIREFLDGYVERDPTYTQIAAITPEGAYGLITNGSRGENNLFKTTNGEVDPKDYAAGARPFATTSAPYYLAVQNTEKPVIVPLQVSPQTGESSFYVAAPAFDATSGELSYVIYSQTDSTELARAANEFLTNLLYKGGVGTQQASPEFSVVDHDIAYFEKTADGKEAEVAPRRIEGVGSSAKIDGKPFQPGGSVFIKENRVVVANNEGKVGSEMQRVFPKYTELRNNGAARTISDVSQQDEREYLLSYAPIAQVEGVYLDWGVLIYEPAETAFAFRRTLILALSVGTGVAAILIGMIAAVLANRATRPLIAATEAVDKIGQGELNTRLDVRGQDEIATLGANINQMATQLQQSLQSQAFEATQERILTAAKGSGALHQSDLNLIFDEAVASVHDLLKLDRVVVYRLDSGGVVSESVSRGWPSAIEQKVSDSCIPESIREAYRNGHVAVLHDVSEADLHPEHVNLLESLMVKSSLVVPIAGGDRLFGLLVAHSCFALRHWQDFEVDFFKRLGTELGLAVYRVTLLEETEKLAEEQRQLKEELQTRALELLQEVEPIGKGNLTIRARVTGDEIGTIADSYNATVDSLRKLVLQVKGAVNQVVDTTRINDDSIQTLSVEASRQVKEIAVALERVEEVVVAVREVATNAKQAERVMQQAAQTVEAGDAAIDRIVAGNQMIRETVTETAKKVEHLTEASQQISAIVNLISSFAAQTRMLAFNVSIEAGRAGGEGQVIHTIAREVHGLVQQSEDAAKEIRQLAAEIQNETNEVATAMETSTEQVVLGTQLIDETRHSLSEVTNASLQINELVQAINQATMVQQHASETIAQTMTDVAEIAQKTSTETDRVSASFEQLREVAQLLQEGIDQFKVS